MTLEMNKECRYAYIFTINLYHITMEFWILIDLNDVLTLILFIHAFYATVELNSHVRLVRRCAVFLYNGIVFFVCVGEREGEGEGEREW